MATLSVVTPWPDAPNIRNLGFRQSQRLVIISDAERLFHDIRGSL
jgi:hypothetical protein